VGKVKALLLLLVVGLIGALCLIFVLQNQQSVALNLFTWSAPAIPVSIYVLCGLLLGMLIGPVLVLLKGVFRRKPRIAANPL
jgi:putative membrane protein